MTRDQLEHVLRAAGAITGHREWIVVGSQAILGARPDAHGEITASDEVDLYVPEDENASDLVDGTIGERSPFHETFGYYAHGVGPKTAILPLHWKERAIVVRSEATAGVTGICPHPSDLAVSKLAAWRDKDRRFVELLLREGMTSRSEIDARIAELDDGELAKRIGDRLRFVGRD